MTVSKVYLSMMKNSIIEKRAIAKKNGTSSRCWCGGIYYYQTNKYGKYIKIEVEKLNYENCHWV